LDFIGCELTEMDRKYIILVGDGMGDYPLDRLGGRTPMEAARTPNMDRLAQAGKMGTAQTIPRGMAPGSDVANMSLLGYDPAVYHTGRGPLEAASMGVLLEREDVAFRCNLVFLDRDSSGETIMGDYSAGHISTPEAQRIIGSLQGAVSGAPLALYAGVSYRHLLVWKGGRDGLATKPPHDIIGQPIEAFDGFSSEPVLRAFAEKAGRILESHPVNAERKRSGELPANAIWLWGQGRAPAMPRLGERFGISGVMVSAVDLLKGIGAYAGLDPVAVPGATGYLDTNYAGKVEAALGALEGGNFAYLHVEAPDEAGHQGSLEDKIEAIERFDKLVVGPVLKGVQNFSKVRILLVTDHYTPVSLRTHTTDPVPFLLLDIEGPESLPAKGGGAEFSERSAKAAGLHLNSGVELFEMLMSK